MKTLEELLQLRTDWPAQRRAAMHEYHNRLALAHCLDCLLAGESEQAGKYLRLAAGTRTMRRRLWQARILNLLPATLRTVLFRLAAVGAH